MTFIRPLSGLLAILCLTGCASFQTQPASSSNAFFEQYAPYAGSAYAGRSVMVDLGENHPLENAELLMHPEQTGKDEIRIRFFVNDDRSRTWILRRADGGLHLSHDHRHEDGSEYDQNFYGGYSDERGTGTKQFFPADERTVADRPAREINVWSKEFDLDGERYFYRLYLRGELRYEAAFDLSNPLPPPEQAAWMR